MSVSNNHKRLNDLFDDTINDVCHHATDFMTSNENFTHKQMLQEEDWKDFMHAMINEVSVHEKQNH